MAAALSRQNFILPHLSSLPPRQNTNSIAAQNKLRDGEESKKIFRFDDNNLPNHVNTRKLQMESLNFHHIRFSYETDLVERQCNVAQRHFLGL